MAEESVSIHVKWIDGEGNSWEPSGGYYPWPAGLEVPKVGDTLNWPGFSPQGRSGEVVGRKWIIAEGVPILILTCDLGEYSGGVLASL